MQRRPERGGVFSWREGYGVGIYCRKTVAAGRSMTIDNDDELQGVRRIGGIVRDILAAMGGALEPGMSTAELDRIGQQLLDGAGALSAPRADYGFPGATCISINHEIAHGVPSAARRIEAGDLVNIDVSASKGGFYADTGASFAVGPVSPAVTQLLRDGRRARQLGVAQVRPGRPLSAIGRAVEGFAAARGYTLVRNLCSHGIGRSLHEYPLEIPTWHVLADRRRIREGMVLTIEPFLSTGALWAREAGPWALHAVPRAATVQFEHTVIATRRGPIVVT